MDAGDHRRLILQLRALGGDEAQHHLLLTADSGQGLEAAAAGIVKFQIVGSHVLTGQQGLGHAVISAGAGVGRVEVAPADMGVDDQILRLAFNGQIVGSEHLLLDGLQPLLVGIKDQTGTGVYQHTPAAIVKLQVAAPGGIYVINDLAVARCQILHQLFNVGVVFAGIFHCKGHDHLLQKLSGCGDRQLGHGVLVFQRLDKPEMLHKGMAVHSHLSGEVGIIKHCVLSMERQPLLRAAVAHTMKAPHEVEVPGGTAEFAVGNYVVSGALLLGNQLTDRLILRCFQLIGSDLAVLKVCPRLLQSGRAKKAANVVIAKRGICFVHGETLLPYQKDRLIIGLELQQVKIFFRVCRKT